MEKIKNYGMIRITNEKGGGYKMKKKIVGIFICMLMITGGIVITFNKEEVKAEVGDGGGGTAEDIGLNTTYIWSILRELCNVTYKADYTENFNIPRGREWATAGENFTISKILLPQMNYTCHLTNPHNLSIEYYADDPRFLPWEYSSKVVLEDFNLTINNDDYPFPNLIPITEKFAIPRGIRPYRDTSFFHAELCLLNYSYDDNWLLDNATYELKNLSYEPVDGYDGWLAGNLTYLAKNESVPEDTDGLVFLIEDNPYCQEQIDNMTNATGCILIIPDGKAPINASFTNCSFFAAMVENTEQNLTIIRNELDNGTEIYTDILIGTLKRYDSGITSLKTCQQVKLDIFYL